LTSNTTLWEQLAEGEKREKILKQEIERAQQEIATQEKIIERLKDDIKQEGREKQKLLQYKNTKSKRLDELETKAREFEVLSSVNLGKILALLESKERKINSMSSGEANMNDFIGAMTALNQ
jgi:Tfp pilus assembly protein PilN